MTANLSLLGHFLFREQKSDESFSSFLDNWTLCDEIGSIQVKSDYDNVTRVIKQLTQRIHNIIVRNILKQFVRAHGEEVGFCSRNVFDAVKYRQESQSQGTILQDVK